MATITETALIVDSPMDLEAEICRYNCHTKEELEEVLWDEYKTILTLNFKHKEL